LQLCSGEPAKKGLKALPRGMRKWHTISNVVTVEHHRSIDLWDVECFTLSRRRACATFGPSDDATPTPRRAGLAPEIIQIIQMIQIMQCRSDGQDRLQVVGAG
jgi:hypothetical protein